MLSGTEADIINAIARFKKATKHEIRKQVGFSLGYVGFLCRDLMRRGFLDFSEGHYSLSKVGIKTLLKEDVPKIDRSLLKEIADEVAKEISSEIKKTVKGIKIPFSLRKAKKEAERQEEQKIQIKTDYSLPVEDETVKLESNLDRVGAKLEKEESNIDKSVELFRKMQKKHRPRDRGKK